MARTIELDRTRDSPHPPPASGTAASAFDSPGIPQASAVFLLYVGAFLLTTFQTPLRGELVFVGRWGALLVAFFYFAFGCRGKLPGLGWAWAFLAASAVSSLRSDAQALALAKLAPAALCVAIMFSLLPGATRPRTYVRTFELLGLTLNVLAAISLAAGVARGSLFSVGRYHSLFGGPNSEGIYAGLAMVLAPALGAMSGGEVRRPVWLAAFVANGVAVYATGSRSSFFAAAAAVAVWFALQLRGSGMRRARGAAWAILAIGLASTLGRDFYSIRWSMMTRSFTGESFFLSREEQWAASVAAFRESPVFGHGFGISAMEHNEEAEIGATANASVRDGAGYFALLESVGVAGTFCFAMLVASTCRRQWRCALAPPSRARFASQGAFVATSFLLVNLVGEPWILGPGSPTFHLFWFFLAASGRLAALAGGAPPRRAERRVA